ncbi:hypothetical protein PDIDSM_5302 [Penicillium digitatum]|nr:hypothetical protein PDIDSM_5302 [Penicillium digitatum]
MDVSLAQVFSSPLGRLQLFEVAAFARELLTGIEYMHINLKITHGALSSNSVLLSVTGAVKIANLGTAMIENNDATKDERDVEAVGMIIIECLEPSTFLRKGANLKAGDLGGDTKPAQASPQAPQAQTQASQAQALQAAQVQAQGQAQTPQRQAQPSSATALQLHHRYAGGRIRTISLTPQRVIRSINPGYTSTGEKIRMIQPLGKLMAAGGQLAIDGARSTGVPDTLRMEKDIHELQNFINMAGGTYGVNWVAIGRWTLASPRIWLSAFIFEGPGGNPPQQEYGISRSALKKILSSKAADRLISEAITYDPDMALQDAISSFWSHFKIWDGAIPPFWRKQQLLESNA